MLQIILSILGIIITILFVTGSHEAAHFAAARLAGVKVLKFSIGFGKALFSWRDKKGTEYIFALIPLGGYVKMLDENEGNVEIKELHLAYNKQPYYKKFLIILAGPVANLFCALMIYWCLSMVGYIALKPVIGEVLHGTIAKQAEVTPNQEILSIDDIPTPTWTGVIFRLMAHAGNQDYLTMEVKSQGASSSEIKRLDLTNWHIDSLAPEPLKSLGIMPYEPLIPLIIGKIVENSPAAKAQLQTKDKIIAINANKVTHWRELLELLQHTKNPLVHVTVERQQKILTFPIHLETQTHWFSPTSYFLGVSPEFKLPQHIFHTIQYPPGKALQHAWQEVLDFSYFNLLVVGKIITGKISLQSLGGPITIFQGAGSALNYGYVSFLSFLAFLSISIGVINLLPIPGLDGGHLLIQTIEAILGKKIPLNVLELAYRLGFAVIIFMMLQALTNDLLRL